MEGHFGCREYTEILMGNFWGSIHLRTDDHERVRDILRELARSSEARFLLTPVHDRWVTVYPSENGQDFSVSEKIASHGHWFVVHLINHDDSQFAYRIFRSGKLLDEYVSIAGYFSQSDAEREQNLIGRPELFEEMLIRPLSDVRRILKRSDEDGSLLSADQMEEFAATLGIQHVATAYEYLREGEPSGIKGRRKLEHIPDKAIEKQQATDQKKAEKAHLDRLIREGTLLGYYQAHKNRWLWLARHPRDKGFLLKETRQDRKPTPMFHWAPQWRKAVKVTDPPFVNAESLTISESGQYAVVSKRKSSQWWNTTSELWDLKANQHIWNMEAASQFQFSPDERHLLTLVDNEIEFRTIRSGEVVKTIPTRAAVGLAVHPSHSSIIINEQTKLRVVNLHNSSERDVYLGGKSAFAAAIHQILIQKWKAIDTEKMRQGSERDIAKHIASLERAGYKSKGKVAFDSAKMKSDMQAMIEGQIERFEKLKSQKTDVLKQAVERISNMKFSKDGELLFCGTNNGLRVYHWDDLNEGSEDVTHVAFSFAAKMTRRDGEEYPAYVYALEEDSARQRLLFGGMDGVLHALDINSGSVRSLHVMPQREEILACQLSSDGQAIACHCRKSWDGNQKPGTDVPLIYVWKTAD